MTSKRITVLFPFALLLGVTLSHVRLRAADSDLPSIVIDEALVRQAITNLIDNAIKYTHEGFIHVHAYQADNVIVVSVQDSGIGIPAADQPRLFEKFYRVKTREAVKMRGSGLGLSIVKSIAELHQGRVWVESNPGAGSTFSFVLPALGT